MGIARVYVGVHWPSDIIGGAILGSLTGWCVYWYYSHHKIHTYHIVAKGFRTLGL
jgi:membrane-associated phospholipid phosphatase